MSALQAGDRIAFAAKFLKNTGQFAGEAPTRRGTFIGIDEAMSGPGFNFARVRWDNESAIIAASSQADDEEWCADVKARGSLVNLNNIAKVGSARFAHNDL